MALTATIALPSTCVTEQEVVGVITISNSDAFPVPLKMVTPYAIPTSGVTSTTNAGVSIGPINFGPNANVTCPASGDLILTFPITFHAPSSGVLSEDSQTYSVSFTGYAAIDVGATSVFTATPDTITVNYAVTFPESQQ